MIVKTRQGYQVRSESGKPLSSTYKTKSGAENRLKQIHYYSNKKGN